MLADDKRHGTNPGYAQGCRCLPCKDARNRYERTRRKRKAILGIDNAIDATGTRRRIQALMALGHRSRDISARCGWTSGEAVLEVARRGWVQRKTAETIARVYDEMSMIVGDSDETRKRARRNGWPVPLAWDDHAIDDPTATPIGHGYTATDRATGLRDMAELGVGITEACRRLHVTREGLEKWCQRNGMSDVYRVLTAREHRSGNQWAEGGAA